MQSCFESIRFRGDRPGSPRLQLRFRFGRSFKTVWICSEFVEDYLDSKMSAYSAGTAVTHYIRIIFLVAWRQNVRIRLCNGGVFFMVRGQRRLLAEFLTFGKSTRRLERIIAV